jgi:hypothetical protein
MAGAINPEEAKVTHRAERAVFELREIAADMLATRAVKYRYQGKMFPGRTDIASVVESYGKCGVVIFDPIYITRCNG